MLETVLSIIAVVTGLASLWITNEKWKKVNAKIAMLQDVGKVAEILPAWYTERMMQDYWAFGLVMTNGKTVAISRITAVSDDKQWMDVELLSEGDFSGIEGPDYVFAVANDRTKASIRIDQIATAYELVTS